MLSNAYFLAKFRFDTAENEPAKNLQNFAKFVNFADPNPQEAETRQSAHFAAMGSTDAALVRELALRYPSVLGVSAGVNSYVLIPSFFASFLMFSNV